MIFLIECSNKEFVESSAFGPCEKVKDHLSSRVTLTAKRIKMNQPKNIYMAQRNGHPRIGLSSCIKYGCVSMRATTFGRFISNSNNKNMY